MTATVDAPQPPEAQSRKRGVRKKKEYANPFVGFAWLRIIGAGLVILQHSWALVDPADASVLPAAFHLGEFGMLAFFAMSGFQVQNSWDEDPSWWRFSARRLLRLLPPLAFLLAITAFVIGPMFTTLPAGEYLASGETWAYMIGVIPFLFQHQLPGLFENNPHNFSENPALWTLPMELVGYTLVLVLGVLIALGVSRLLLPVALVALVVTQGVYLSTIGEYGAGGFLFDTPLNFLVKFMVAFVIGMIMCKYADRIKFRASIAWALLAVWLTYNFTLAPQASYAHAGWEQGSITWQLTLVNQLLMAAAGTYGAITLAHHWPKKWDRARNWALGSYGMYLFAGAIQQSYVFIGIQNQWLLFVVSLVTAYLFGVFSWNFIERPSFRLRKYLKAKDLTATNPAPVATPRERAAGG